MWRLVLEGVATLTEVDDHWSLEDVLLANDALTVRRFSDDYRGHVRWR